MRSAVRCGITAEIGIAKGRTGLGVTNHCSRRHCKDGGLGTLCVPILAIVAEIEQLVFDDRSTQNNACLIHVLARLNSARDYRSRTVECRDLTCKLPGIKIRISEVFIERDVNRIAARLDRVVLHTLTAVLRADSVGLDLKLVYRVDADRGPGSPGIAIA